MPQNRINKIKKFSCLLIPIVVLSLLALLIFTRLSSNKKIDETKQNNESFTNNLEDFIRTLPYKGERFEVSYKQEENAFYVEQLVKPSFTLQSEIKQWFLDQQGIEDISTINIIWIDNSFADETTTDIPPEDPIWNQIE